MIGLAKVVVLGTAALLVASCGMNMPMMQGPAMMMASAPPPMPEAPMAPVMQEPMATPGLAARERLQLAINSLQQGDSAKADVELKAYIAEVPNNAVARKLLGQIETPIGMLYPADNFTVQLGPNETLSTLSGVYLGDVLGFYGLARYNAIMNPSRVSVGQAIKIPRTPEAIAAQTMRMQMMAPMQQAGMMEMTPTMPPATQPLVLARPQQQASAAAPPARAADPWVSIRSDVSAGRFDAAIRTAEMSRVMPDMMQAAILASAYAANARAVRASNAGVAGTQALRAGELYLNGADQPELAIPALTLAIEINPMDAQAKMLLTASKTRAADIYYRSGLVMFQRQDLDGAIAAWDKALAIDPDHKNAQLNRAQALELKQNLQRLR